MCMCVCVQDRGASGHNLAAREKNRTCLPTACLYSCGGRGAQTGRECTMKTSAISILSSCRGGRGPSRCLPVYGGLAEARGSIATCSCPAPYPTPPATGFLPIQLWYAHLASHPDQRYAAFLCRGIVHGFQVGFSPSSKLKRPPPNLPSAHGNATAVDKYITAELNEGRLAIAPMPEQVRVNPIGLIPKPHQPGKYRLIVDLSSPEGFSVNDGIDANLCSLEYATVDDAASLVRCAGPGALMAKLDLSNAYRHVPVHPIECQLLGVQWRGIYYCDRALPFGLRSAQKFSPR